MLYHATVSLKSPDKKKNGDAADVFQLDNNLVLFLLADGVGGSAGDWKASSTCVKEFAGIFSRSREKDIPKRIEESLKTVNQIILSETGLYRGMKSTFVVAVIDTKEKILYYTAIGDSRLYKVTSGKIELLTTDQVKAVMIRKPDGNLYTKNGSVVTAFGVTNVMGTRDLTFRIEKLPLTETTGFLMASDGFYRKLTRDKEELKQLFNSLDVQNTLNKISSKVEQNQDDDATAIFFRFEPEDSVTGAVENHRQVSANLLEAIQNRDKNEVLRAIDYIESNRVVQSFDYYDKAIKLMREFNFEDGEVYQRLISLLKKAARS